MKITVSVTNDLVTDQRVHKVCTSLQRAGYEVKLIGRRFRDSRPLVRTYRTDRMRLLFNRSFFFYAEYNIRLFFYLLFERTDLFLSNDTDSLPANYVASRIRRKPLIFDAHEIFPEAPEITSRKGVKAVWTAIERNIFPRLKYCYTVCRSIADYYRKLYGVDMQVVRNIPFGGNDRSGGKVRKESKLTAPAGKKIILYQGAVNVGRGIEQVVEAMPYLDDFIFYVIGDGDVLEDLKEMTREKRLDDRVCFLGRIPFEELADYTSGADIGVNLLENKGLNYYFSLPNRIFDFIRAGVPVLANDFPEIGRIVSHYRVGKLVSHFEPLFLAEAIRELATTPRDEAGFARANAELTWENEASVVLEVVRKALEKGAL